MTELTDDFRGNNKTLFECIKALIELSDAGALVPHGLGGHAKTLLSAAAVRLAKTDPPSSRAEPVAWQLEALIETQEHYLRTMVSNYKRGDEWDSLDLETCEAAADEIKALRTALSTLSKAPQAGGATSSDGGDWWPPKAEPILLFARKKGDARDEWIPIFPSQIQQFIDMGCEIRAEEVGTTPSSRAEPVKTIAAARRG